VPPSSRLTLATVLCLSGGAASLTLVSACRHAASPSLASHEAPTGIAVFTKHAKYVDAKISPKGTFLAVLELEQGKTRLAFIDLAARQIISRVDPGSGGMVGRFFWANDERVIAELVYPLGYLAPPVSYGELYAVNASARNGRVIFGYQAGDGGTGTHFKKAAPERAWGHVLYPSLDEKTALIEATPWDDAGDKYSWVYTLDINNGVSSKVTRSPFPRATLLTDELGEVRLALGRDAALNLLASARAPTDGKWSELATHEGFTSDSVPVLFSAHDRAVHVLDSVEHRFGLYAVNIDSGARSLLSQNDTVEPSSYLVDDRTNQIVAVEYEPDLPLYDFVQPEHPYARLLKGLGAAFPDRHVRFVNATADAKQAVVLVASDRDPGTYMLADVEKMTVQPIIDRIPWIRPDEMAEVAAFHFKASDGVTIHGYLTRPRTRAAAAPPLVVLPHGGPHGVRDHWAFNSEVQLLASEGFAVLQVNYRGSSGYGRNFTRAGFHKWGDRVVQDIVDATRFVVGKGLADGKRVCSYGGSFGAYAAMQSAILAPDLFRCAVGYAGVYDLTLMPELGDIQNTPLGQGYVRTAVGDDPAELERASPVHNADKLQARVLLIHGSKDERTPIEHAERLRQALSERGRPVEWLVEPNEAHGFYDEAARERMYRRLLDFIKDNTRAQ